MGIESEADKDLALGDQDAENVIGGRAVRKTTKRTAAAKPRGPLMIEQAVTYGPTEISANSGDDDCALDPGDSSDPGAS